MRTSNKPVTAERSSQCSLAPWQAKRVAAYIESNISLNFCVADLAAIVRLSISHFSRAFKVSFGQPPITYVKVRRVRHAQILMLNTREPLSKVALDCGLYDQSHLTRLFRKFVGISPSLWRRQFQCQPTLPGSDASATRVSDSTADSIKPIVTGVESQHT